VGAGGVDVESDAVGCGPFEGFGVEAADVPAVGVGFDAVGEAAEGCEVLGVGLAGWAEGVVGLDVGAP